MALIGLAGHLVFRLGRVVRMWWWFYGSLAVLLLVDTLQAVMGPAADLESPGFTSAYLLTYAGLALAATHPSVVQLSTAAVQPAEQDRPLLRGTLIAVAILPAIAAMIFPMHAANDRLVRSVLVSLLLALLFVRFLVTGADLSRARALAARRGTYDSLTGLPNRAATREAVERVQARSERAGVATAVLLLACTDLKDINDVWGRPAGDSLLRHVAERLRRFVLPGRVVGRHGGDEFALVTDVAASADATRLGDRLLRALDTPFHVTAHDDHRPSFRVGIAVAWPEDRVAATTLLGQADVALTEARTHPRENCVLFDTDLEQRALSRARIAIGLGAAIRDDAFTVEFQPIVGGPDHSVLVGWEALVRWSDATLGAVSPDAFIPLAEEWGLIDDIGRLVLRRACRDLAELRAGLSRDDLMVSVNVSAPQLFRPDFADFVLDTLRAAGLPGACLCLEITETLLVDRAAEVLETVERVRAAGVRIVMDDFGTGYASLETLLRLPVDGVKIDRSLVTRLGDEEGATRQLGHLLDLLRSLGMAYLVAEGVETPDQEAALRSIGCPYAQGWLHGRPATAATTLEAARSGAVARKGHGSL